MTDLASILSDRLAEGAFALVLILLMLQVGVLLVTLRLRFSIPRLLRTALPLLLCFLPFAVFVSLPRQIRELSLPVLCRDPDSLIRLPAALYLGSIVLSLLMLGADIWLLLREQRSKPSESSVKHALDLLPAGICVSDSDGNVIFSNDLMYRFCRKLTGSLLTDAEALQAAVAARGAPRGDSCLVRIEDRAFLFLSGRLSPPEENQVQFIVYDVTDYARKNRKLERRNERLRNAAERLRAADTRGKALALSREAVNARYAVHNQMGSILLTGKYYLDHPDVTNEAELKRMLTRNNDYLLESTEQICPTADPLGDAVGIARSIGLTVEIVGPLPEDARWRTLLAEAVTQCAANAVRHAGASRLTLTLRQTAGRLTAVFTNDGIPPAGPIREGGGLGALRQRAEQTGCAMEIRAKQAFRLILRFP